MPHKRSAGPIAEGTENQMELQFDGATIEPEKDNPRLSAQLLAVKALMSDGAWRTLGAVSAALAAQGVAASEAGVSARLRDLRKARFGAFIVERRRVSGGLFEYRVPPR